MKKHAKKQKSNFKKIYIKKTTKSAKRTPRYVELKGFLSFFILHDLSTNLCSGDELAREIGERKGTTLTPGTIYPALKRLRRQKLIQYKRVGRKKVYSITLNGKNELKALYFVLGDMFSGLKGRLKR